MPRARHTPFVWFACQAFLVSQKMLEISWILASSWSATPSSNSPFVPAAPASFVASLKRVCRCGYFSKCGSLEVVGPQHPEVVLDELGALLLDDRRAHPEVGVVVPGDLLADHLDRLGLDAGLGGVVDAAGQVAVGADLGDAEQTGRVRQSHGVSLRARGRLSRPTYPGTARFAPGPLPIRCGRGKPEHDPGEERVGPEGPDVEGRHPLGGVVGVDPPSAGSSGSGPVSRLTETGRGVPDRSGGSRTRARPALGRAPWRTRSTSPSCSVGTIDRPRTRTRPGRGRRRAPRLTPRASGGMPAASRAARRRCGRRPPPPGASDGGTPWSGRAAGGR